MKKRQNAELRKPDILKNYYQVIIKEGFEGASIAKVAKRMKINPSLIVHYFKTKDNMTVELVNSISHKYNKLFMELNSNKTNDPVKRLEKLCEILISDEWNNNTEITGDISIISVSYRNKKVFAHLKKMYDEFIILIKNELDQANATSAIKIKDTRKKAEFIVSFIEGYRYFKHFYMDKAEIENFKKNMKKSILSIISSN